MQHRDRVGGDAEPGSRRSTIGPQRVGARGECVDVDGQRKDHGSLGHRPVRDDVLAGERARHEPGRGLRHDPRQHEPFQRPHPFRPRLEEVVVRHQDVRHAPDAAPEDRQLRRHQAPAGDDDELETAALELAQDTRCEGVVVVENAGERQLRPGQVDGLVVLDRPRPPLDGSRRIEGRHVELGPGGERTQVRDSVRRRLAQDERDAERSRRHSGDASSAPGPRCRTLPAMSEALKEDVRSFWERQPCGAKTASAEPGSPEFFRQVEEWRYSVEPFIPEIARFDESGGKDVLEVGIGLATDFVRFVRAGANATGIDLTEAAVAAARERLRQAGLVAEVLVADAESLPFENASFDVVYSYGVLHHTPDTAAAVREVHRVLRPGGEARIMLYSRRSWFALAVWARHAWRRRRPWHSLTTALAQDLESPGTKAYTESDLERLFAPFSQVELCRFVTPYDRSVAGPLASLTGPRFGWFFSIVATR